MAKHTIHETTDGKWALVEVPEAWRDGDLYPAPAASDRYFDTEAEATSELLARLPQPPADDVDSN